MKRILLSVLTVLTVCFAKADDKAWYINTNTNVSIPVENVDYLLAADDDELFTVVVKSGENIANVSACKFSQPPTGIENINADNGKISLPTKTSNRLLLSGLKTGTEVCIFSVDGRLIKKVTADGDSLCINVADIAKGTYVLRTKFSDVKFIKQ